MRLEFTLASVSAIIMHNGVSMLSRAGSREGIVRLGW